MGAPTAPALLPSLTGENVLDFGAAEVGVPGPSRLWHIVNQGTSETGPLTASSSNDSEFELAVPCPSLAPGAACDVNVSFNPSAGGARTASLSVVGTAGSGVTASATGQGQYRLTLTTTGQGTVRAAGTPGLECGTNCTALFEAGTALQLQALPSNGSNAIFTGWSGGACPSTPGPCNLTLLSSQSVNATFSTLTNNLAFVSSIGVPADLGGAAQYDAQCNQLATAAGVNVSTGDGFVAMISDPQSTFLQRLGSARGWVRMDRRPFVDAIGDLVTPIPSNSIMYYPVRYTEFGIDSYFDNSVQDAVWTGTEADGSASTLNCNSWTVADSATSAVVGNLDHSPALWTGGQNPCDHLLHLICLGRTRTAPLVVPVATGKRIWVTDTVYVPGSMTPDAKCAQERPAGVASARALIAYAGRAAADVLDPTANYVRPDGQLVGTGAQIARGELLTGPWLTATSQRIDIGSWTGSDTPTTPGTADSTCNDWTSSSGAAPYGLGYAILEFWHFFEGGCDSGSQFDLYCVEP